MVYLNLSVESIELSKEFYADKLNFFRREAGRLVCKMGVDLILDLVEIGSEQHMKCFGQNSHVPSDFWIHAGGDDGEEIFEVLDHLNEQGVNFENIGNLGGNFLKFIDPTGNKFTFHTHLGATK